MTPVVVADADEGVSSALSIFRPTAEERPRFMKWSIAFTALLLAVPAFALPQPDPPELEGKSYVLLDYESGQVLAANQPDLRQPPASLTKVMTVYIAFDELKHGRVKPDDETVVSEKAWRRGYDSKESRMFIEVGKRVTVEDLLHGIIVQSGNDASIALAEHLAGTEDTFAELMNRTAARLGLQNTHFANATGVPAEDQYTTARDVALLSRALIREFPDRYALFKQRDFTYNGIRQPNRNLLLWRDDTVDGIKTGHTESAGYHLSASAVRDGRRLISVVMGTSGEKARAAASLALLNYGFRFFETVPAVTANAPVATIRAWKGTETQLPLGVLSDVAVAVPHGGKARLTLTPQVDGPVYAPVAAGQALGTLTISLDGEVLKTEPLVALAALPEGSWWRKLSDEVEIWFQGLM